MEPLFALLSKAAEKALAFIPDPVQKAKAQLDILSLQDGAEARTITAAVDLSKQQSDINASDSQSGDPYTRRWRPTIGYIIAAILAFQYLINPILLWFAAFSDTQVTPPAIAMDGVMWELITGMLGLAGWRTLDKIKGK